MKTKQIIDEVDVSWCEWIREIELDSEYICTCNSLNKTSSYCKDNPNCYYKQLKRVENQIVDLNSHNECFYKDYKRKEQECEKLKEAIDGLLKIQYQLADSCNKYVQTLTKIKEIALGVRNYLACPSPRDVRYEMDIILQKISECEVENGHTKED